MFNPYLEEFNKVSHSYFNYRDRDILVKKYAWAVPNTEAIEAIQALETSILEIGAGSGYWAKVLSSVGINVEAFDYFAGDYTFTDNWFDVKQGSIEKIKDHSDKALFLCWPDYDKPFALKATLEYMRNKGKTLIYIGEGYYGCTGCNKFHKLLGRCWNRKQIIDIPQWGGIHDRLYIYTRE